MLGQPRPALAFPRQPGCPCLWSAFAPQTSFGLFQKQGSALGKGPFCTAAPPPTPSRHPGPLQHPWASPSLCLPTPKGHVQPSFSLLRGPSGVTPRPHR